MFEIVLPRQYDSFISYTERMIDIVQTHGEPMIGKWEGDVFEVRPGDTPESIVSRQRDENMEDIVKYRMSSEYEEKEMEEVKRKIADQRKLDQIVLRLPRLASAHDNEKRALKEHIEWCIEYGPISGMRKIDAHLCYVREVLERHGFVKNEFEGVSYEQLTSDHVRHGRRLLGHVIGCAYHFPPLPVPHPVLLWMENWVLTCPW